MRTHTGAQGEGARATARLSLRFRTRGNSRFSLVAQPSTLPTKPLLPSASAHQPVRSAYGLICHFSWENNGLPMGPATCLHVVDTQLFLSSPSTEALEFSIQSQPSAWARSTCLSPAGIPLPSSLPTSIFRSPLSLNTFSQSSLLQSYSPTPSHPPSHPPCLCPSQPALTWEPRFSGNALRGHQTGEPSLPATLLAFSGPGTRVHGLPFSAPPSHPFAPFLLHWLCAVHTQITTPCPQGAGHSVSLLPFMPSVTILVPSVFPRKLVLNFFLL